ncbi:MAG: ABC transporter permease subunit [Planctomycetota bacterium]
MFRKTLRDLRGQVFGWGLGLAVPSVAMILFFPYVRDLSELEDLLRALPPAIQQMVGDPAALTGLEGFLRLKLYSSVLPLFLGAFVVMAAASAIAGERERGTIDLLLAQPVRRWRVVVEKFAALSVAVAVVCAFVAGGLVVGASLADVEADRGWIVLATFNAVPLGMVLGGIAFVASCCLSRARPVLVIGGVVIAWSLLLETLVPMVDTLRPWRPLSPLYPYAESLPLAGGVQPGYVVLQLAFAAVLVAAAAWIFERKDLVS